MSTSTINAAGNEITSLFNEAERMLDEASTAGGERAAELKKQGMQLLSDGVAKAKGLEKVARDSAKALANSTDNLVHENPWRSMAVAGAIGAAAGLIIGMAIAKE